MLKRRRWPRGINSPEIAEHCSSGRFLGHAMLGKAASTTVVQEDRPGFGVLPFRLDFCCAIYTADRQAIVPCSRASLSLGPCAGPWCCVRRQSASSLSFKSVVKSVVLVNLPWAHYVCLKWWLWGRARRPTADMNNRS